MPPVNVLLISEPSNAEIIRNALERSGFDSKVRCVNTPATFQVALQEQSFDLVLSDHDLPGFNSFAVLATIRKKICFCPVVFISTSIGEEAIELLKSGAADFIIKDRMARLPEAIGKALGAVDEAHERARLGEKIAERAALLDAAQGAIVAGDLETTRQIKASDSGLVVIMMTADDNPGCRAAAKAAGADGFVGKAGDMFTELQSAIRRAFPGARI